MRILLAVVASIGLTQSVKAKDVQTALLAGGCFWCIESDLESVEGVLDVVSGYTGGKESTAKYKIITSGKTKHREAVKVTFDADKIPYRQLVEVFFKSIDPYDATGSFCDRGKSYSAAIFADPAQLETAKAVRDQLQESLTEKIVTPILKASAFYPAEDYHQNYYKSDEKVLTRFGLVTKAKAYKRYRKACGRDAGVRKIWGDRAVFAN